MNSQSAGQYWHKDIPEVAGMLATDMDKGLQPGQVEERQGQYGPNQLIEQKGPSAFTIFLEQFHNFIIWVLIGAALVSGLLQEWGDAIAIITIVILNAILGFIQEYRAEKSLAALKKLSSPTSKVIRRGQLEVISSFELVPGDIIELEAGDNIPADSRISWLTANFTAQEASLTGESTPAAQKCLAHILDFANLLIEWLYKKQKTKKSMDKIILFNNYFIDIESQTQASLQQIEVSFF
jgi:Ca2+-transporting ATPase